MKKFMFIVLMAILVIIPQGRAAWEWWSPNVSNVQPPTWSEPSWSNPIPTPQPNPNPNPNLGNPILPVQPSVPDNKVPSPNPTLSADEMNLINQVNEERIKNGQGALKIDYGLVELAKKKSHDMATNSYFSHVSPTLGTVYTMLDRAGIGYSRAGENIARTGSIARIHPLFMSSAAHRANILHSGYTHIGVGILKLGTSYHVTQIFIKK